MIRNNSTKAFYILMLGAVLVVAVAFMGQSLGNRESYVFNLIYRSGHWGRGASGEGSSGPGSTEEVTREYRRFLETLIREEDIASVVDAGCGDWEFSQYIDWGEADYLGIDVSSVVVDRIKTRYSRPKVRFQRGSLVNVLLPADLLIVKDVLNHLPNEDIMQFIRNNLQPGRYKIAVLTHDRSPNDGNNNGDIIRGNHRGLDLANPPFNLQGLEDHLRLFEAFPDKVVQVLRFD